MCRQACSSQRSDGDCYAVHLSERLLRASTTKIEIIIDECRIDDDTRDYECTDHSDCCYSGQSVFGNALSSCTLYQDLSYLARILTYRAGLCGSPNYVNS